MGDGKNMPAVLLAPEHCIEPHEHRRHPIARFRMGEREQLAVRRGRMVKGYAGSQPVAFETRQVVKTFFHEARIEAAQPPGNEA